MSLASRLPYDHAYAGGYPGIGSQQLPTDADALDYLSRVKAADGAGVEVGVATAVDAFFKDAKELGVLSSIRASCILAGARTLAGALVPVVGDAPTNVANGFVEGDFSRSSGLTGDGATTHLDTGRAYADDPQNSNHIAAYLSAINADENYAGAGDTTVAFTRLGYFSSLLRYGVRTLQQNGPATLATGFMAAGRSDGSDVSLRYNGASTTTSAASVSTSGVDVNYTVFVTNYENVGLIGYSASTIAFYSFGEALNLEALDTAVTNLIARLKFAILVGENPSGLDPDTIDYIVRGYEAGGSLE
jgi:hypothetical protein